LKAILHLLVSTLKSKRGVNSENHGVPEVNLHRPTLLSAEVPAMLEGRKMKLKAKFESSLNFFSFKRY